MKLLSKSIGILGHGKEGRSIAAFLKSRNVRDLVIFDEKKSEFPDFSAIDDRDVLFRSPGIHPNHPALQNFRGKIMGGTELFLQLCPTKKVIGVTGTKGKGTTTALITSIFQEANDTVFWLGNMGHPFFDELPNIRTRDVVVAELSSFQLWDCEQSPQIAVVLGIMPDHLEVHDDFDDYVAAKKNIVSHQKSGGKVVYFADCPHASSIGESAPKEVQYSFSVTKEVERGAFLRGEDIIWKSEEGEEVVAHRGDISLTGEYNLQNILAAIIAAKLLNVRTEPIKMALQKFTGLPYRLQKIAVTKDNITFWNDSYATLPPATIAAIQSFTEPLILVCGGSHKNLDYSELGEKIAKHKYLKAVLLIGKTGEIIEKAIAHAGGSHAEVKNVKDFSGVFKYLSKAASSGDHIALSPASASFDQFKNASDRGEKWNTEVNNFIVNRK